MEYRLELLLRSLLGVDQREHDEVHGAVLNQCCSSLLPFEIQGGRGGYGIVSLKCEIIACLPDDFLVPWALSVWLGEAMVVNDNAGSLLKTRNERLQDLDCILVGSVMDNPAVEVYCEKLEPHLQPPITCLDGSRHTVCSLYGLRGEVVVPLQGNSVGKLAFEFWCCGECLWEILDDKFDLVEFFSDCRRDEPMATSDIDNGSSFLIDRVPIVIIDEELDLIAGPGRQRAHGAMELFSAGWVFTQGGEHGLLVNEIKSDLETGLSILLRAWEAG